jgi:hypothetical protein
MPGTLKTCKMPKLFFPFRYFEKAYNQQLETRRTVNLLIELRSGNTFSAYLDHLKRENPRELFHQIRKQVLKRLSEYQDTESWSNAFRIAVRLEAKEFSEQHFKMALSEKNLERAAVIYSIAGKDLTLSAPELKSFVKQLVDAGNLELAITVLDAAPKTSPELKKEVEEGYKRVLLKCASTRRLDQSKNMRYLLNIILGRMDVAAGILGSMPSELNRFNACMIKGDYVGAENVVKTLHLYPLSMCELLITLYTKGKVVTAQSANITCVAAQLLETQTEVGSVVILSFIDELLNRVLYLHNEYPNGNPVVEGFNTNRAIDALLLRLTRFYFEHGYDENAFSCLEDLKSRHPEIMERL